MKIISTGAADILIVDIPDGARELKVFNDEKPYLSFFEGHTTPRIYLPEGYNYTILGRAKELTEEQCHRIFPSQNDMVQGFSSIIYDNHLDENDYFDSAKESFASLLKSQGILIENPMGESKPNVDDYLSGSQAAHFLRKWEEFQSKIKNPLIIKADKI